MNAIRAGENEPMVFIQVAQCRVDLAPIRRVRNDNGWKNQGLAAKNLQPPGQVPRLLLRTSHEDPLTKQRSLLEPLQVGTQTDHRADEDDGGSLQAAGLGDP